MDEIYNDIENEEMMDDDMPLDDAGDELDTDLDDEEEEDENMGDDTEEEW